jgi:uncharacterized protein
MDFRCRSALLVYAAAWGPDFHHITPVIAPPRQLDGHVPGSGPWVVAMRWHDLLFAHWRVDVDALRRIVPAPFEIETFDGSAWVGIVPFRMSGVRPRVLPPLPGAPAFPEVNVRTYVSLQGHRGVWFLSLDAADRLAVEVGRRVFRLPYYRARIMCTPEQDGWVTYASARTDRRGAGAVFLGRYRPSGPVVRAQMGSLPHFLTARDGLWSLDRRGAPAWVGIRHAMWPLQRAELELETQSLSVAAGLDLAGLPEDLWFSRRLDVVAWRPVRV